MDSFLHHTFNNRSTKAESRGDMSSGGFAATAQAAAAHNTNAASQQSGRSSGGNSGQSPGHRASGTAGGAHEAPSGGKT
jgi:hypothetical protein